MQWSFKPLYSIPLRGSGPWGHVRSFPNWHGPLACVCSAGAHFLLTRMWENSWNVTVIMSHLWYASWLWLQPPTSPSVHTGWRSSSRPLRPGGIWQTLSFYTENQRPTARMQYGRLGLALSGSREKDRTVVVGTVIPWGSAISRSRERHTACRSVSGTGRMLCGSVNGVGTVVYTQEEHWERDSFRGEGPAWEQVCLRCRGMGSGRNWLLHPEKEDWRGTRWRSLGLPKGLPFWLGCIPSQMFSCLFVCFLSLQKQEERQWANLQIVQF